MADERGSVLMLMPAVVLVLVVLGGISVDSATVFLAQRELVSAAAAAANDAAAAAMDDASFYEDGDVVIDPARAREVAIASVAARAARGMTLTSDPEVTVVGDRIEVVVHAEVPLVFAPAVPGVSRSVAVTAVATATAVER